jgi:hypothetical protein
MDHDRLFKQLLTTFFAEFVELFLPELSRYLKRDSIEFLDKEVFTDLTRGERHEVDLVVRSRFLKTEAFFLIHVENQATRQPEFSQRMFRYFARLHEKFGLSVYPIALLSYDAPRTRERGAYEVKFPDRRVLSFRYRAIQLNRLNWRNFLRNPNPIAAALMTKMKIPVNDRPRVKLECLRMIVTLKLNPARTALIRDFINSYLALSAAEEIAYNQELQAVEPKQKRKIVQIIDRMYLTEVRLRSVKTCLAMLKHRFGVIQRKLEKIVELMPIETLDQLQIAILDFQDMKEAKVWIEQHKATD